MNTETPYTLCAEMLATLRANLLRGTITTQDDAQFQRLLDSWGERLTRMDRGGTLVSVASSQYRQRGQSSTEPHPLFVHEPAEDASALRWEQNHMTKEGVTQ